jgi:hypothetical protein
MENPVNRKQFDLKKAFFSLFALVVIWFCGIISYMLLNNIPILTRNPVTQTSTDSVLQILSANDIELQNQLQELRRTRIAPIPVLVPKKSAVIKTSKAVKKQNYDLAKTNVKVFDYRKTKVNIPPALKSIPVIGSNYSGYDKVKAFYGIK